MCRETVPRAVMGFFFLGFSHLIVTPSLLKPYRWKPNRMRSINGQSFGFLIPNAITMSYCSQRTRYDGSKCEKNLGHLSLGVRSDFDLYVWQFDIPTWRAVRAGSNKPLLQQSWDFEEEEKENSLDTRHVWMLQCIHCHNLVRQQKMRRIHPMLKEDVSRIIFFRTVSFIRTPVQLDFEKSVSILQYAEIEKVLLCFCDVTCFEQSWPWPEFSLDDKKFNEPFKWARTDIPDR